MKQKIIIFLVGLLLGAIISTGSIYIYTIADSGNKDMNIEMPAGNKGQGGMMENNGTTPPEIPNKQNAN